ncbi:DUF5412 family protein [Aureibacillus halotolerans]|uniref:Uncharacterized protein n=1 Tax=Aureibacillus halotolerans TaxID=1508390 RepID=A0A4R6UCR0_9BACI|nr:DUF5412 family protein [Aureibacillus halotolerans]TDQ40874.1 hypothetical protein EV213_105220 [Aureibacillus halotolerans]
MMKISQSMAFYGVLFCLVMSVYSLFSTIHNMWQVAPPRLVLLLLVTGCFVTACIGIMKKTTRWGRMQSWMTFFIAPLLGAALLLSLVFTSVFPFEKEYIASLTSPEGTHQIDVYATDGGATTLKGIMAELNGPLWFTKRIFIEHDGTHDLVTQWEGEDLFVINGEMIQLPTADGWF